MNSKDLKNALKAAREAIRNKEFKEALAQCKVVLAEDKNNYNALVFVGVAAEGLDQYEQARKAYFRAAEISPEQPLAWQGLSTMHTKSPGWIPKEEMIGVYEKLIELQENDSEKQQDALRKLIDLIGSTDVRKTLVLYEKLIALNHGTKARDILVQLIEFLQQEPQLKPEPETKLFSSLQELLSSVDVSELDLDLEKHGQIYLQLVQKREPEQLFEECSRLVSSFPKFIFPLETKLHLLIDGQIDRSHKAEVEEVRNLTSILLQRTEKENSAVLLLSEGFLAMLDGNWVSAKKLLNQCVDLESYWFCGHFYLAHVLFKLHEHASCRQICDKALSLVSSKTCLVFINTNAAAQQLNLLAARSCVLQATQLYLEEALNYLEQIRDVTEEAEILRAYIYLDLGDQEQLQACLEKLKETETTEVLVLKAWIDFHKQDYIAATCRLQECVKEDSSNAGYHLKLGRALWEQRWTSTAIQEQCFNALVKAAKLDPYLSGTFLCLGHFYAELKKDQQRAKKCYQKAFDLDSSNEEAGAALCDIMATLGEDENVLDLLQRVTDTSSAGCAKWAWLRLGLAQVRTGDLSAAAASFQSALRADPSDRHMWECLAEAYLHRGSFTAALKAFNKAAELHSDSAYSLYQMASIKQKLGMLQEAADECQTILDKSPEYVPALKGLGETYLMLTQRYLAQFLIGLATDTCEKAIACLTRAAAQRPDLSCLWKLLGDCCTSLQPLNSHSFRIYVPKRLSQIVCKDNAELVEMSKVDLLELGTRCYGKALKILPDSAPLWHDLGISFFYLNKEKKSELLMDKCIQALKKSLSLDPSNHLHWTGLGVVAASQYMKNPSLAQHCFIKSVQCETNNAVAWTNLGALYLQHENVQLAHEAFKVAQSQEPEYMTSWIGQALIAETVGHEEAMDLFRHTTELGIHLESCLGYGHWVISTLLDVKRQDSESFQYSIKQMAAIPAAADALMRYTAVVKDDPCVFNLLGLLLEHQDLKVSALSAFQKAVELAEQSDAVQDELNKIKLNLSRLLSKNERYTEAASVYESCVTSASFADVCQLGLLLYRAGQLQDSDRVYQQALSLAPTESDKSDVYAALGMVSFKSGNLEDAKTVLFEGFQLRTPSLQGLFALCALGLLQGDITLTQATLQEFSNLVEKGERLADVVTLTTALKIQQGMCIEALDYVQQLLTTNSNEVNLYMLMSRLGLGHHSSNISESSAKLALSKGGPNYKNVLLYLAVSQLHVGKHSHHQSADNAVRTAQKAFHCRPDISALLCLVSALHGEAIIQQASKSNTLLLRQELHLIDLAMASFKITSSHKCWCLKQKALCQIMLAEKVNAAETLQQLWTDFPEERDLVMVLRCVINSNQTQLEPIVTGEDSELFLWQILLLGLMKARHWAEAKLLLRKAMQKARNCTDHVVKLVCLVNLGWLAAQQHLSESGSCGDGDSSTAVSDLEEVSRTMEQLSDQPYTLLQVLQALLHIESNPKKAKYHFANVLQAGNEVSNLGVEVSLARRGLIFLLNTSDKDQELVQKFFCEAEASGDIATVTYYKKMQKTG